MNEEALSALNQLIESPPEDLSERRRLGLVVLFGVQLNVDTALPPEPKKKKKSGSVSEPKQSKPIPREDPPSSRDVEHVCAQCQRNPASPKAVDFPYCSRSCHEDAASEVLDMLSLVLPISLADSKRVTQMLNYLSMNIMGGDLEELSLWASAVSLKASDHDDVQIPPEPASLAHFRENFAVVPLTPSSNFPDETLAAVLREDPRVHIPNEYELAARLLANNPDAPFIAIATMRDGARIAPTAIFAGTLDKLPPAWLTQDGLLFFVRADCPDREIQHAESYGLTLNFVRPDGSRAEPPPHHLENAKRQREVLDALRKPGLVPPHVHINERGCTDAMLRSATSDSDKRSLLESGTGGQYRCCGHVAWLQGRPAPHASDCPNLEDP